LASGGFKPSIEGPLMGGTCLLAVQSVLSKAKACGAVGAFVVLGEVIFGTAVFAAVAREASGTGVAPAGLRASSKVPHIPQKRKLFELFSPHFGQIKDDPSDRSLYSLTLV
jgi:hypothetical protein